MPIEPQSTGLAMLEHYNVPKEPQSVPTRVLSCMIQTYPN